MVTPAFLPLFRSSPRGTRGIRLDMPDGRLYVTKFLARTGIGTGLIPGRDSGRRADGQRSAARIRP